MNENYNFLLQKEFYNGNLFVITDKKNSEYQSLGSDQKGLIVLLSQDDNKDHADFLAKILAAIKYDLATDALRILTIPEGKYYLQELEKTHHISRIICFGTSPQQLGLNIHIDRYTPSKIGNIQLLFADKLTEIKSKKEKKAALWAALQNIFLS